MKNILVAVDHPGNVDQLISQTVKLARLSGAKIWIIHVTEPDPDDFLAREAGPQYVYEKRAEERKKEDSTLKRWAAEVERNHKLVAEGILIEGSVVESIKKLVEDHHIDLVVAGHEKRNYLYSLFTGNKKRDLIDELKIPLLAVPLD